MVALGKKGKREEGSRLICIEALPPPISWALREGMPGPGQLPGGWEQKHVEQSSFQRAFSSVTSSVLPTALHPGQE